MTNALLSLAVGEASWRLRCAGLLARGLLTTTALALIAVPIVVALKLHENSLEVSPQAATAPVPVSAGDAARWRSAGVALPAGAAPVVLAYHDIRPTRAISLGSARSAPTSGVYNVTPEQLDQQLTALQAARFRSITAAQYVAYLEGGRVPSRSVLITFDGATQGLWAYADQILARHHMHGLSFLNPRAIETHWTRFLSWREIERMQAPGRWEFGSALSRKTLTGIAVGAGPARVTAVLAESTRAFKRHGLPLPRLLALPMPVRGATPRPLDPALAARVVHPPFVAALASGESLAPATSRRAAAGKLLGRIEVSRTTNPIKLLASMASQTAVPVSGVKPLARRDRWTTGIHDATPVKVSGKALHLTGKGRYENVAFAADSSADWNNYVLDATVQGLPSSGAGTASVVVRVGSVETLAVRVSARSAAVIGTRGSRKTILRHSRLLAATRHHVRVVVRPHLTRFTIDHGVEFTVPEATGPRSAGGIGLSAYRQGSRRPWPSFSAVTVVPATAASTSADKLKPISLQARTPLAASSLWFRNRFAHAAVRATAQALQFTGARIRDFAQYAPLQTSGWIRYAFSATAENLLPGEAVYVYARPGSKSQALAAVGPYSIKVFSGVHAGRRIVVARRLAYGTSHRLSLQVLTVATLVQVDGVTVASVPATPGSTGGIAVGAKRGPGQPWPRLNAMTLGPAR